MDSTSTAGETAPTTIPVPAWAATDDHREVGRLIETELGERAFRQVCDLHREWVSRPWPPDKPWSDELARALRVGFEVENLEDGPPAGPDGAAPDAELVKLFERGHEVFEPDDGCWPLGLVDEHGNRYSVEVEVTVRPEPPLAVALARHDAEVAQMRRYEAAQAARKAGGQ